MYLRQTEHAFAELVASRQQSGVREGDHIMAADQGYPMGDVPFEFGFHEPQMINPASLMGAMTSMPYVTERIPDGALDVDVVLHVDPAADHEPAEIQIGRTIVIDGIYRAIKGSSLFGDRTRLHIVGSEDKYLKDDDAEHVPDTETPEAAAEAVLDIVTRPGLGIVISTFKNLPLAERAMAARLGNFDALAVKANHVWERELPANIGEYVTGRRAVPVIDTNDRRLKAFGPKQTAPELEDHRGYQADEHAFVMRQLQAAGFATANAIFDRSIPPFGYNGALVDASIADGLQMITRR